MKDYSKQLTHSIFELSAEDSLRGLFHQHLEGNPLPSARGIRDIVELSRTIIFPGYFGSSKINRNTVRYHIGVNVERLFELLTDQISAALCFQSADNEAHSRLTLSAEQVLQAQHNPSAGAGASADTSASASAESLAAAVAALSGEAKAGGESGNSAGNCGCGYGDPSGDRKHEQGQQCLTCNDEVKDIAMEMAFQYISSLSELRSQLALDVKAAFDSDPAATSFGEVICCYPGVRAIGNYRIAHQLLKLGVPLIPRAMTEMAHSETGIDIHPGAQIGSCFAIDHGTGVVIGETCIIGNNVKLYQGVTLGAKSIPVDAEGVPLNIPRHPILEDDVVVYSNATILGRITIGKGAVIGGNVWITEDVQPSAKIIQMRPHR